MTQHPGSTPAPGDGVDDDVLSARMGKLYEAGAYYLPQIAEQFGAAARTADPDVERAMRRNPALGTGSHGPADSWSELAATLRTELERNESALDNVASNLTTFALITVALDDAAAEDFDKRKRQIDEANR